MRELFYTHNDGIFCVCVCAFGKIFSSQIGKKAEGVFSSWNVERGWGEGQFILKLINRFVSGLILNLINSSMRLKWLPPERNPRDLGVWVD